MNELKANLAELRGRLVPDDVVEEVISDDTAEEVLKGNRPSIASRSWPKSAKKNAYYSLTVLNPTSQAFRNVHLTIIFTPGFASNQDKSLVNSALAARDHGIPTYTSDSITLPANSITPVRIEFPIPELLPPNFKFLVLGLLWGSHSDITEHYYDVQQFWIKKL